MKKNNTLTNMESDKHQYDLIFNGKVVDSITNTTYPEAKKYFAMEWSGSFQIYTHSNYGEGWNRNVNL